MELKLVAKTYRSIVIELTEAGRYYSDMPYEIYVNGELAFETNKVVNSIFGLKPNTEYTISVKVDNVRVNSLYVKTDYEYVTLNVKDFNAYGDGVHNDTNAIQAAIMACPANSRVYVPAGVYKITSLFLKSNITIELAKDAVLSAFTDRTMFPIFPGIIENYDENEYYNLGTWEGNPIDMFSGIICGVNVENVVITGEGTIDGCADFDNWWHNPKVRNIAWRPRLVFLNNCTNVMLHGITVQNSPSWTLHPYFSKNLKFVDIKILNPFNSHNTDGLDPESCEDVEVIGVYISVGDDCIAIKSGKIYMGKKFKKPTIRMTIRQCCMRDGHGAVTVGSEIAAGVKEVKIESCVFMNTDRGLRVKTRRGRGQDSVLDNIIFEDIKMDNVMTPFVVNSFYFCDPDGKSEYVASKEPLPIDDRTPSIKRLVFKDIEAKNCHVAGAYIYGLPEQKIEEVVFENIIVDYADDAKPGVAAMMLGCDETAKQGIVVNNIEKLVLKNVTVLGCEGEEIVAGNIGTIERL
ncbi:MAG: glycoside hydrolase family 28 protein [Lachnospira sp.]|nr:glycoside hydrolase family 28 protein [Lachnospira sp.]